MGTDFFTQLVDAHYASLHRFALSLCRQEAAACDLTQQTFYLWATKGHALRDTTKARSWLFTTLHREFLRTRRRDQRWTSLEDLPAGSEEIPDDGMDQLRRLDGAAVLEALSRTDEIYRTPLALFYLEQFSYLEIASTLDLPPGTVMSRLSRGKEQLRKILQTGMQSTNSKIVPFTPAPDHDGRKQS